MGAGHRLLVGTAGADTISGEQGPDTLKGGLGADVMIGLDGNDTYWVDDAGDETREAPGGGQDRVIAVVNWRLAPDLERLSLSGGSAPLSGTGNDLANRLDGNAGANRLDGGLGADALFGLGGADTLLGGEGADVLDGGAGADSLVGGAGDDRYHVDHAGDVVVEGAGGGNDQLVATLNWTLGAEIERLSLTGTADLNGVGNALANRLDGNAGANALQGGDGADALYGGAGNDTLLGEAGNDLLLGGLGEDRLLGGAGGDRFVFRSVAEAQGDAIQDFNAAEGDRIDLRAFDTDATLAGHQPFAWIGAAAFGNTPGQLRFAGGSLQGDLDGDGSADFQVVVTGAAPPTAGAIWL